VFTVEIEKTKNVSILKDLIKEKKARLLSHVDASDLELTQVSLPVNDDLEGSLKKVEIVPLAPLLPLSQVFPHVEQNRLHIVVQAPTNGEPVSVALHVAHNFIHVFQRVGVPRTREARSGEIRSRLCIKVRAFVISSLTTPDKQHLTGFQNVISRILKAESPSDSAKSFNYTKSQIAYSIYDGRYEAKKPRTSVSLPIQLFHPAFGHFLDNMKNDNIPVPDDIIRQTTKYMISASAIYKSEEIRRAELTPLLCAVLGVDIQMILNEDKTNPDGIVEKVDNLARWFLLLKEDKNEFGDGGSDPSTQAGLSAARCWAQSRVRDRSFTVLPSYYSFPSLKRFGTPRAVPHS
jgi:hypothetical protein